MINIKDYFLSCYLKAQNLALSELFSQTGPDPRRIDKKSDG